MNRFKDKVAIVTGGASGIGRELCRQLGGHGATVIVADVNREGAEEAASSIAGSTAGRARAAHLDVTDAEEVRKLIRDTAAEFGRLDYMFNNAGIAIGGDARDMDWEHWRRILDINLMGVIYGSRAAYSVMVEQGFGHSNCLFIYAVRFRANEGGHVHAIGWLRFRLKSDHQRLQPH